MLAFVRDFAGIDVAATAHLETLLRARKLDVTLTSAHPLTSAQQEELKATLKGVTGKDVAIAATVDPSLLGGLVVKIGSRQIDTSLRTKLNSLKLALKEVG